MDENFTRRVYLGGFLILVFSLFYYQVIKGDYYLSRAKNNYVRAIPIRSIRGQILDRNAVALARDRAAYNIAVIPYQIIKNKDAAFGKIADFLGVDLKSIKRNYKRGVTGMFSPVDVVTDVDKKEALTLKEKYPTDITINSQPQRYYPYSYECSHILGYVKSASAFYDDLKKYGYTPLERAGFSGLEQYYDVYLKGEDGGDLIEVDSVGRTVGFLGKRKPTKGKDIYITIDSRIQNIIHRHIKNRRGTVIVMNSDTGEIISLVSSPSYDANQFIVGRGVGKFFTDSNKPLLNRAIQATYPLGSTFKPIMATAGLEEMKITPFTPFMCNGSLKLGRARFRCWSTHGKQDLYRALAHSCNVYFYNLGLILEADAISLWAKRFHLDALTEIDLPYEKKGFVPSEGWKRSEMNTAWYGGDTVNFSIGQGFMEGSPIALLVAINAFAVNGYIVKPYLLKSVGGIESRLVERVNIGIPRKTLDVVRKGIKMVVHSPSGTARKLKGLGLGISGKTGTAQTNGKSHGWFAGFFEYNKTKYSFCVFLENSGSSHFAVDLSYDFLKELKEKKLL
ncbi:MAG: penicillin-binding protein 2 [Candidatus Omnitrophica bacterium]|nr:penicillin-binding protein 2 [Candidatus Omnitrophota bacterium]